MSSTSLHERLGPARLARFRQLVRGVLCAENPGGFVLKFWAKLAFHCAFIEELIELGERIIAFDRNDPEGWEFRGLGYRLQGNLEDAAADIQMALNLSPENPTLWRGMAEIRCAAGKLEEAREACENALRHDSPDSPKIGMTWYLLSWILYKAEDLKRLLPCVRMAARRFSDDPRPHALLAKAELLAGNWSAAADAAQRAISQRPDDEMAWLHLALAQILAGNFRAYRRTRSCLLANTSGPGSPRYTSHRSVLARALRAVRGKNAFPVREHLEPLTLAEG